MEPTAAERCAALVTDAAPPATTLTAAYSPLALPARQA